MNQEDKFEKEILEEFGDIPPFEPCAYYDPSGDCIEFLFSNTPHYAERLDRWVTVYFSEQDKEIVGGLVKDIRPLMKEFPGLDIEIEAHEVAVACVLRAPAWSTGDPVRKQTYKAVIEKTRAADLRTKCAVAC